MVGGDTCLLPLGVKLGWAVWCCRGSGTIFLVWPTLPDNSALTAPNQEMLPSLLPRFIKAQKVITSSSLGMHGEWAGLCRQPEESSTLTPTLADPSILGGLGQHSAVVFVSYLLLNKALCYNSLSSWPLLESNILFKALWSPKPRPLLTFSSPREWPACVHTSSFQVWMQALLRWNVWLFLTMCAK